MATSGSGDGRGTGSRRRGAARTPADPTVLRMRPGHPTSLSPQSRRALRRMRRASRASAGLSPHVYNLTISHEHRFVWFRNAKVGTRTILSFFEEQQADNELLSPSLIPYPTAAFADYYKFGFVRHPLDRFISAWQDKVHGKNKYHFKPAVWEKMKTIENFAAWVAGQDLRDLGTTDRHIALQSRLVDLDHVDYLGRIETFATDFGTVCREIGLTWNEPERRNRSEPRGVTRENASAELRSIVEEKYRLDYQIFGY